MPKPKVSAGQAKDRMYSVAIMCPNANFPTSVGIGSDKSSFHNSVFKGNAFSCAVCGQMHTWEKRAAFLMVPQGSYVGERFEDEEIVLDSSSFDRCEIRRCGIHLSRGNFRLTNCKITESRFNFAGEAAVIKSIADDLKG